MKLRTGDLLIAGLGLTLACVAYANHQSAEWLALGLIILAGIPHGSFDLRAAEAWLGPSRALRLTLLVGYIIVGLGMSALCLRWPGTGLLAFLIISAIHFSEGEMLHSSRCTAVCLGISAILLPIGLHVSEASGYLNFFASQSTLDRLAPYVTTGAGAVGLTLLVSLVVDVYRGEKVELLQCSICILAWLLLPPLSGFCVWFIGRHSRQHLERCHALVPRACNRLVPWDFIALSITAIALLTPLALWFDLRDLNQLFAASIILIAGLTLPHMVLTHLSSQREQPR
jgi:Brp/Blh family beta-carotene 15,15'-monooxygenase